MPDDLELDLSDLMAQDTTDATQDDATPATEPDAQGAEGEPAPSTTQDDPRDAEIMRLKQHVDNLLARIPQPQQGAQNQPQAEVLPDISEALAGAFDAPTTKGLKHVLETLERRLEAKFSKAFTPRSEWDAAQPVLQQAVLTVDEQRVVGALKSRGLSDQQIVAAKNEADRMIASGQKFSSYDAYYRAGVGEVLLAEKLGQAQATKAARDAKAQRAALNDNTPAHTPATKGKITLSKDTLLNRPFDALDELRKAGVK